MKIGNAYELKNRDCFQNDNEYRCAICYKVLDLDDERDEKFIVTGGKEYHKSCIDEYIRLYGQKYISDCCYEEFLESQNMDGLSRSPEVDDMAFADKQYIFDFITDCCYEEFIWWAKDEAII